MKSRIQIVGLFFLALSFQLPSIAQTYIGVWRSGNAKQSMSSLLNDFTSAEQKARKRGYTNWSDMETVLDGQTQKSCIVFEKPRKNQLTWTTFGTWREIQSDIAAFAKGKTISITEGRRARKVKVRMILKNIEAIYDPFQKTWGYLALFEKGTTKQKVVLTESWDQFVGKWKQLGKRKMRLRQVETFASGGRRCYIGIFNAGTYGYYLYQIKGWKSFVKKWEALGKKNYRLIDVETFVAGGKRYYLGVWVPGKDGYVLYNVKGFSNFSKKFKELRSKGLELIDIEVIP